ncbi:solute carrier family 25, member 51 [Columba livia]|uniref:Solute carrier family 25, member 51 n=1 Tax=Columba livia TaxID=8932 RepID=A0A2I0LHU1_COLLI|nr:solute carrier family 25, member 51 [Columba livia]
MDSEGSASVSSKEYLSSDIMATSGKHYVCGYCAAFTNIAVTFPIQKVLFRQQLYGLKTKDAVHQLQKDGMRNLYRGILPPLMQKTTTLALMFGLYEDFSSLLLRHASAPELLTRPRSRPSSASRPCFRTTNTTINSQTLTRLSRC